MRRKTEALPAGGVGELQGLYGPLQVLEGKVQQVWALQQLQAGAWRTRAGRRLRVRWPGRWNRGAGPDFRDAVMEIDGAARVGDVELHLYREDWWRHGHDADAAYDRVILHVVVFAGGMERPVRTRVGSEPEEWVLGPWLREDLEAVSGGEPGLFGELAPELREWLESDLPETLRERLRTGADRRWQDKEAMARCLLEWAGWEGALHRMMLFCLGYPHNRRPFFEMAEAFPLAAWRQPELLAQLKSRWEGAVRWGLGRPANRAEPRLCAYLALNGAVPDWPRRLRRVPPALGGLLARLRPLPCHAEATAILRRAAALPRWRAWLQRDVLGGRLNGSLADRLWVDALLPLLAADSLLEAPAALLLWFHAYPGQFPDAYRPLLKLADIQRDPARPFCNGWIQGLLWVEDQLRIERLRTALGTAP